MATVLPPPEVEVTTSTPSPGDVAVDLTVTRDGANRGQPRTYKGEGRSTDEAVKDVVKKLLDDPMSGEFIRK